MDRKRIYLSSPHMGGGEMTYVKEASDTNWVAPLGANVDGFERNLEAFIGAGYAAALSSGTAALHLALIMLGVEPGDVVICQSMTFSASANAIAYVGATPVFVDSEAETWNMDPDLLEGAIQDLLHNGRRIKAIIPVHLYGMPAKMGEIMAIASRYDIPVIEDAAESQGSSYQGKAMGTFGRMGVLSFNGNKIITTSGGGALIGDDPSNFWLTAITIDPSQAGVDREGVRLRLLEENIESRPLWKPMHRQPVFGFSRKDAKPPRRPYSCRVVGGGVAEDLFERGLCLPSGSNMTEADMGRIGKALMGILVRRG